MCFHDILGIGEFYFSKALKGQHMISQAFRLSIIFCSVLVQEEALISEALEVRRDCFVSAY